MTTAEITDLGLDFDDLEREAALANRPTYNKNPLKWRGKLESITQGSEMFNGGQEFPRHSYNFSKIKILDAGHCQIADGQPFALLMEPHQEALNRKVPKTLTTEAKSTRASGEKLTNFVGQEVEVTEQVRTYKKANGYDGYDYWWKFERAGAAEAPAPVEIPDSLIEEVLTFISVYGQDGVNHLALAPAIMQNQALNKNKSLNDQIMAGKLLELLGTRVTLTEGIVRLAK